MKHSIPTQSEAPLSSIMAEEVQKCVHCGFCLPTCPTYQLLGQEMDSPRGRILLMKEVLEGNLEASDAAEFVDKCLGCVACQTACPSGVKYGELVCSYRAETSSSKRSDSSLMEKLRGWMVSQTLPYPSRFRLAMKLGRAGQKLPWLVPKAMQPMIDLVPESVPTKIELPEVTQAIGQRRAKVALLAGCAQQVLDPQINVATIEVLSRNGVEVIVPKKQSCCGALAWHQGQIDHAQQLAQNNLDAFPTDVDAVITNAAGCGSGIEEYSVIFRGTSQQDQASSFAKKATDICQFLDQLGLVSAPSLKKPTRVAYHDACHLAHAQGIRSAPRNLLRSIENLELVEIREGEMCCGSAGTYNIDQPEIAHQLGERKTKNILEANCDLVAAGNIGCLVQIQNHLKQSDRAALKTVHTIQILHAAYQNQELC